MAEIKCSLYTDCKRASLFLILHISMGSGWLRRKRVGMGTGLLMLSCLQQEEVLRSQGGKGNTASKQARERAEFSLSGS